MLRRPALIHAKIVFETFQRPEVVCWMGQQVGLVLHTLLPSCQATCIHPLLSERPGRPEHSIFLPFAYSYPFHRLLHVLF